MLADDIDELRLIPAVNDKVHDHAVDQNRHRRIHRELDIAKDDAGDDRDCQIDDQKQGARLDMPVAGPQNFDDDIRSPRRTAHPEDDAQPQRRDRPAEERGKEQIVRNRNQRAEQPGRSVDGRREDDRGIDGRK